MASQGLPPAPEHCTWDMRARVKWGAATAAYQIEGGVIEGGRTPSIWDTFSHTPGITANGDTGDVACDHYHKFKEDFALMKELGIKHYRFSISWSRIVPFGIAGSEVNPHGLEFYDKLLDAMAENGIEPYVTLFHWDLPQVLQDNYEGFISDRIVGDFVYYADVVFRHFGWRVKNWMTFNEPWVSIVLGYGKGEFAPGKAYGDEGQYKAGHHLLLAHVGATKLYNEKFRAGQGGKVGIVLNVNWMEPRNDSDADRAAARRALEQDLGWFAAPLYTGDYPEVVRKTKPVPAFTDEQRAALLANKPDFFALNWYTTSMIESDGSEFGYKQGSKDKDDRDIGPRAESSWLYVTPWAFYHMLRYVQDTYQPQEVWVTENGVSAPGEAGMGIDQAVRDEFRVNYYSSHLDYAARAMAEGGVKLTNYFAWSFMDNFEWRKGYTERFGIVAVDFNDPNRRRAVKDSGRWLSEHFFKVGQ